MYSIGLKVSKSTINCFVPNGEIDSEKDIKVPVHDEKIENIKDYMTYYKFIVK